MIKNFIFLTAFILVGCSQDINRWSSELKPINSNEIISKLNK